MSWGVAVVRRVFVVIGIGLSTVIFSCLASALVDVGPTGSLRLSLFPLALTWLDPFVWTCVWNSAFIASVVTVSSLVIGVGLAQIGSAWRFRGRSLLWLFAMIPLAAGPLIMAPAIGLCFSDPAVREWLATRSFASFRLDDLFRWSSLIWIEIASHAPIVALATASAIRRIEPAWIDAAKAVGASRSRIWREILWPNLRPDAARAAAAVFTLTLIEPAGPWILGLDRTLALQILDSVRRRDEPTYASCLALMAILLVVAVRTLVTWWGGTPFSGVVSVANSESEAVGSSRAFLGRLFLLGWIVSTVGPILWLLVKFVRSLQDFPSGSWSGALRSCLDDSELNGWVANSTTTAALAVLLDLALLTILFRGRAHDDERRVGLLARLIGSVPPLALGVGSLGLFWLLGVLSWRSSSRLAVVVYTIARELDPARSPGLLLIMTVAILRWPMLRRVGEITRETMQPGLMEFARLMGLSNRRATEGRNAGPSLIPARVVVLALALAATSVGPALLMSPMSERRTIAPAILLSVRKDQRVEPRIGLMIAAALAARGAAFVLASRTRVGSLGDWYQG